MTNASNGPGRVAVEHQPLVGPCRRVAARGAEDAAGFVGDADDVGVEQRLDAAQLPFERGQPLVVAHQLAAGAELLEGVGQGVALRQHRRLHGGVALAFVLGHRHQPMPGLELLAHARFDRLPGLVAEQGDDRDQDEDDGREGGDQDADDEPRRPPGTFTVRSRGLSGRRPPARRSGSGWAWKRGWVEATDLRTTSIGPTAATHEAHTSPRDGTVTGTRHDARARARRRVC